MRLSIFSGFWRGAAGGFCAASLAHLTVALLDQKAGAAGWLKGPYGPPFFNISLFMAVLYGGIAWALSSGLKESLLGLLGPFLGIALPMAVLTRLMPGQGNALAPDPTWYYTVVALFIVAVWGTIFALGFLLSGSLRGAFAAVLGAFAGYVLLSAMMKLAPDLALWAWPTRSFLPQPTVLLDGLLTGAGIGAAVGFILRRKNEKTKSA